MAERVSWRCWLRNLRDVGGDGQWPVGNKAPSATGPQTRSKSLVSFTNWSPSSRTSGVSECSGWEEPLTCPLSAPLSLAHSLTHSLVHAAHSLARSLTSLARSHWGPQTKFASLRAQVRFSQDHRVANIMEPRPHQSCRHPITNHWGDPQPDMVRRHNQELPSLAAWAGTLSHKP